MSKKEIIHKLIEKNNRISKRYNYNIKKYDSKLSLYGTYYRLWWKDRSSDLFMACYDYLAEIPLLCPEDTKIIIKSLLKLEPNYKISGRFKGDVEIDNIDISNLLIALELIYKLPLDKDKLIEIKYGDKTQEIIF